MMLCCPCTRRRRCRFNIASTFPAVDAIAYSPGEVSEAAEASEARDEGFGARDAAPVSAAGGTDRQGRVHVSVRLLGSGDRPVGMRTAGIPAD